MSFFFFFSIFRGKMPFSPNSLTLYRSLGDLYSFQHHSIWMKDYAYSHKHREPHKHYFAAHSELHRHNQRRAPEPSGRDCAHSSYFHGFQIRPKEHRLFEMKQMPLLLYSYLTLTFWQTITLHCFRPHMILWIIKKNKSLYAGFFWCYSHSSWFIETYGSNKDGQSIWLMACMKAFEGNNVSPATQASAFQPTRHLSFQPSRSTHH